MLLALLLLLFTVTMMNAQEKPDYHEKKPEPSCIMVEEEITTCKMEAIDLETKECLYEPVICLR